MTLDRQLAAQLAVILALVLQIPFALAQAPPSAPAGASNAAAAGAEGGTRSDREVRREFSLLLRNHPYALGRVLALDPGLLASDAYLADYPAVARFVAAHPQVRRNPGYFLADFEEIEVRHGIDDVLEPLVILATFAGALFGAGWLIRTIVEQKRWNRLALVHNKVLDRFGTSDELLAYVSSPAGTRFLESAPVSSRVEPAAPAAPAARVLWSVQLGVVVAIGALGLLLVSYGMEKEAGADLFGLGVIALCIGIGFIASAGVSIVVARRLGLWRTEAGALATGPGGLEDGGRLPGDAGGGFGGGVR